MSDSNAYAFHNADYRSEFTVSGPFFDAMTMWLGNRFFAVFALAALAQWKDGEQLRFWAAFWMYVIPLTFMDALGSAHVFTIAGRRWGHFCVLMFVFLPLAVLSLMKVHKQLYPNGMFNRGGSNSGGGNMMGAPNMMKSSSPMPTDTVHAMAVPTQSI